MPFAVEAGEELHRRIEGRRLRDGRRVTEPDARLGGVEEGAVREREEKRLQGRDDRHSVGGVVDGLQRLDDGRDLLALVEALSPFEDERNAGLAEGVLEQLDRGMSWDEDRDPVPELPGAREAWRSEEVREGASLLLLDLEIVGSFGGFSLVIVGRRESPVAVLGIGGRKVGHGGPRSDLRPVRRLERRVAGGVLPAVRGRKEPGTDRVDEVEERLRRAEVARQDQARSGREPLRCVLISLDVGPAETVDRLLRVADQE